VYHLIFCPKRRRKVLKDVIATNCQSIIKEVCEAKGWEILELAIEPDHVHVFVRCWPTDSAAEVVKAVKGPPATI
jgi:putative transposase